MKNNRLIKNTFFLLIGGFITKILAFIIKILYTRYLKEDGVSLITLIFPTYSLLLTISGFALPLAITKLIAENKERKSKILFSSFWITTIINLFLVVIIFLFAEKFSVYLLHEPRCTILIKILCITLPFVSTTSLIKAYFFGIENVMPIILSNISEEIMKLLMIIIFLPKIILKGTLYGTIFYLFINLFCELSSFICLFIFLPKKFKLKNLKYKYDNKCTNSIFKICIPTLSGKIIGNIGFFIEPILLTNLLIYKGLNSSYIRLNYGYFHGYVIQLLTIPSFFLMALSSNIIPTISKLKCENNINKIKKLSKKITLYVVICGTIFSCILSFFGENIMLILFKNNKGLLYLKILLPFFVLFYLENPLLSILQSLDQEKKVFKITSLGIIVKYISFTLLVLLNFKFLSIVISEIINIIFVVSLSIYDLKKTFVYLSK